MLLFASFQPDEVGLIRDDQRLQLLALVRDPDTNEVVLEEISTVRVLGQALDALAT